MSLSDQIITSYIGDGDSIALSEGGDSLGIVDEDVAINFGALSLVAGGHEEVGFGMVAFDNSCERFSDVFFVEGGEHLLLDLHEGSIAVLFDRFGNLVGKSGSMTSRFVGVGEDTDIIEVSRLNKVAEVREMLLCFSGESDN